MKFEPEAAGEFPDKTGNGRHRPIGSNRLPPNTPLLFEKRVRRESTMALAAHALSVERPATAPGIGPSLSEAGPFVPRTRNKARTRVHRSRPTVLVPPRRPYSRHGPKAGSHHLFPNSRSRMAVMTFLVYRGKSPFIIHE